MTQDVSTQMYIVIPGTPPNGNHYVRHTRQGRHYRTAEAERFIATVASLVNSRYVVGREFQVEALIYLAPEQKGDADGFGKVLLDALAAAGIFRRQRPNNCLQVLSDAYVTDFHIRKFRADKARTEVRVIALT